MEITQKGEHGNYIFLVSFKCFLVSIPSNQNLEISSLSELLIWDLWMEMIREKCYKR